MAADSLADEDGLLRTRISWMRSQAPLMFRQTREPFPDVVARWGADARSVASVRLAAGAAGPLGGDQLRIDVRVGGGAMLMVRAVSATLLLPGPHGLESSSEVTIRVAATGTLVWMPGRQIAAEGCRHASVTRIELEPGARLFAREELLLGREAELPGALRQRLRVTLGGVALYDQEVAVGAGAPGWQSSVVTGGRRALGSVLIVDPAHDEAPTTTVSEQFPDTAVMRLAEEAVLVASAAPDAIELDRRLSAALVSVG
ncbi:urease accessory protein UreD [Homoserinimonas sp. A520]